MSELLEKDYTTILKTLQSTGVFVTCGSDTPNIMVAHWGTFGKMWGKQIFTLPVRSTKYSYRIISQTESFALNVPARDMRTEISLCDTISGFISATNSRRSGFTLNARARSIRACSANADLSRSLR